jgi:hypothetical protein
MLGWLQSIPGISGLNLDSPLRPGSESGVPQRTRSSDDVVSLPATSPPDNSEEQQQHLQLESLLPQDTGADQNEIYLSVLSKRNAVATAEFNGTDAKWKVYIGPRDSIEQLADLCIDRCKMPTVAKSTIQRLLQSKKNYFSSSGPAGAGTSGAGLPGTPPPMSPMKTPTRSRAAAVPDSQARTANRTVPIKVPSTPQQYPDRSMMTPPPRSPADTPRSSMDSPRSVQRHSMSSSDDGLGSWTAKAGSILPPSINPYNNIASYANSPKTAKPNSNVMPVTTPGKKSTQDYEQYQQFTPTAELQKRLQQPQVGSTPGRGAATSSAAATGPRRTFSNDSGSGKSPMPIKYVNYNDFSDTGVPSMGAPSASSTKTPNGKTKASAAQEEAVDSADSCQFIYTVNFDDEIIREQVKNKSQSMVDDDDDTLSNGGIDFSNTTHTMSVYRNAYRRYLQEATPLPMDISLSEASRDEPLFVCKIESQQTVSNARLFVGLSDDVMLVTKLYVRERNLPSGIVPAVAKYLNDRKREALLSIARKYKENDDREAQRRKQQLDQESEYWRTHNVSSILGDGGNDVTFGLLTSPIQSTDEHDDPNIRSYVAYSGEMDDESSLDGSQNDDYVARGSGSRRQSREAGQQDDFSDADESVTTPLAGVNAASDDDADSIEGNIRNYVSNLDKTQFDIDSSVGGNHRPHSGSVSFSDGVAQPRVTRGLGATDEYINYNTSSSSVASDSRSSKASWQASKVDDSFSVYPNYVDFYDSGFHNLREYDDIPNATFGFSQHYDHSLKPKGEKTGFNDASGDSDVESVEFRVTSDHSIDVDNPGSFMSNGVNAIVSAYNQLTASATAAAAPPTADPMVVQCTLFDIFTMGLGGISAGQESDKKQKAADGPGHSNEIYLSESSRRNPLTVVALTAKRQEPRQKGEPDHIVTHIYIGEKDDCARLCQQYISRRNLSKYLVPNILCELLNRKADALHTKHTKQQQEERAKQMQLVVVPPSPRRWQGSDVSTPRSADESVSDFDSSPQIHYNNDYITRLRTMAMNPCPGMFSIVKKEANADEKRMKEKYAAARAQACYFMIAVKIEEHFVRIMVRDPSILDTSSDVYTELDKITAPMTKDKSEPKGIKNNKTDHTKTIDEEEIRDSRSRFGEIVTDITREIATGISSIYRLNDNFMNQLSQSLTLEWTKQANKLNRAWTHVPHILARRMSMIKRPPKPIHPVKNKKKYLNSTKAPVDVDKHNVFLSAQSKQFPLVVVNLKISATVTASVMIGVADSCLSLAKETVTRYELPKAMLNTIAHTLSSEKMKALKGQDMVKLVRGTVEFVAWFCVGML